MAETRWRMESSDGTQVVEMQNTAMGHGFLVGLRMGRPDLFKHARIKSVLQMQPDLLPIGTLVNMSRFKRPAIRTQLCDQRLLNSMMRTMAFQMWAVTSAVYADAITAMHQMYLGIEKS